MKKIHIIIALLVIVSSISCKKYLDAKPDKSLVLPSTIEGLQAVLDNHVFMNDADASWDEASADNYYLPEDNYNTLLDFQKEAYIWQNSDYTYASESGNDWGQLYDAVYFCNLALENIETIERNETNHIDWDNVKGSALFYRAQTFLHTVWIYSKTYDESTAKEDYGIVLRTVSDFNVTSVRATVQQTYDKIISDFEDAATLLPSIPQSVTRPSKAAVYAYLARTYMSMREYDSAYQYANLSLQIKSDLMDYNNENDVSINSRIPFKEFNSEVIFQKIINLYYSNIYPSIERIDTILFNSYNDNDLRKVAFFRQLAPGNCFKGSYAGSSSKLFTGMATDEVFLMRAECEARLNNKEAALKDLNTLMGKRWKAGFFIPFTATTAEDALNLILAERRKELIFRGLRWMDIKRLNKEGANIILTRLLDGKQYTLSPNDKRYALPLPLDIISSEVPQNEY